jgi:hypothetical protein
VIRTKSPYALDEYGPHDPDLEWPHDNKLHFLKIEYLGLKVTTGITRIWIWVLYARH